MNSIKFVSFYVNCGFCIFCLSLVGCATNQKIETLTPRQIIESLQKESVDESSFEFESRKIKYSFEAIDKKISPIENKCSLQGGVFRVDESTAVQFTGGLAGYYDPSQTHQLPSRIACVVQGNLIWGAQLQYSNAKLHKQSGGSIRSTWIWLTVRGTYLTAAEMDAIQVKELAVATVESQLAEQRKKKQQESLVIQAEVNKRNEQTKSERAAAFRKNLKAGDKIQWMTPGPTPFLAVGMVVRIEGDIVFVQFDNFSIRGDKYHYIRREELNPMETPPDGSFFDMR